MKSLALHLSVLLLLAAVVHNVAGDLLPRAAATAKATFRSSSLKASAAAATTPTTTTQPPSLPKPHRHPSLRATTAAMTIPTTTTTAAAAAAAEATTPPTTLTPASSNNTGRRRQLLARRTPAQADQKVAAATAAAAAAAVAAAAQPVAAVPNDAATFTSARLVRNANVTLSNVRQNRSFQSGGASAESAAAAAAQRSTSNAVVNNNENNNNNNKDKANKLHRRLRPTFRLNENIRISTAEAVGAAATATTTTTTSTSTTPTPTPSPPSSSLEQQSLSSSFMASQQRHLKQQRQQQQQQQQPLSPAQTEDLKTKQQRTTKTPRMIHRLMAGHIQNAEGHSKYHVSSVTTNSSITSSVNTTTSALKTSSTYFRRKPVLSSSYRQSKLGSSVPQSSISPATLEPPKVQPSTVDDRDDDEALLDESDDLDNWDHGILRSSAGGGRESLSKSKKKLEDSKKTLSDQVRDGKYGLIEKELFRREPKRPGVLSYLPNKEVPIDNERNFGGLNEEDIWLAEDHLLVIKGGGLNEGELNEPWPPIDDYDAPGRQIKLPPNPKVPPPFPVQLEENGPLQFIGNNKFTVVYPVANESLSVYTAGPETNYASSESDDEKNLLTRPGSPQNPAEDEPSFLHPTPPPPWLYHNQTFVNPFLNNARPINFPGLGPFPFGRNGSLDSANGTDYFDEDDPSLYYPPAYSFVYKNNYTNPVPPGPLVPGIVLPPPPDQFSRLEKHGSKSTASAPPTSRHRIHSTTTTTTTASPPIITTTVFTTTDTPHRHIVTKIREYKPKTITVTSAPPILTPSSEASPKPAVVRKPPATLPPTVPVPIEPIPVPVAVPVPIYPSKHFVTSRPNHIDFVPTTPEPRVETFSKSNPIYYEYFEPKREPTTANTIEEPIATTPKPALALSAKPIKIYATSKRPFNQLLHHQNYLDPVRPQSPYIPENVVYITPKPEIRPYRYKSPSQQHQVPQPLFKQRPLVNFEREVNAIRQTLRYYHNQQLHDNNIPRTPKAKHIYEYSYDAEEGPETRNFQPPAEYDEEPFKPMVTYSPPVDDENSFRAIAYDKQDSDEAPATAVDPDQNQQQRRRHPSTATLIPIQPPQGRPKKLRQGAAKYLDQSPQTNVDYHSNVERQKYSGSYQSIPRTVLSTQPPWVSLDKQVIGEYQHPEDDEPLPPGEGAVYRNRGFQGYYYGPPPPPQHPSRQNNRFYDEPFQDPVRKIVNNYRPPALPQQQPQEQRPPIWSLENDTYVNYAPQRPPLNPDAEFINPYEVIPPLGPYESRGQRFPQQQSPPPPAISHQYYGPPQRFPVRPQPQQQSHPSIPLHRDILVNYRQPLPPINPDSEYISHPHVAPIYRSNAYESSIASPSPQPAIEPSNVFYISPKYRRESNNRNGNNNNDNRQ